ncbi:hypothetical protein CCACVL1_28811 [Corchorus capsularis]|uniref:Uncharacterized protein n=1 Tax=Corchorus capsularis TaxID=210143 RepID=A0A1R3G547_COCAP|nr:hypothetical protein CCACVL1_28811 [Corchorus capsularis]
MKRAKNPREDFPFTAPSKKTSLLSKTSPPLS